MCPTCKVRGCRAAAKNELQVRVVEGRASREPALSEVERSSRAGTPGAPSDEHFVLRNARAVFPVTAFLAEENFHSGTDRVHQSVNLAQRRDYGFVDDFAGLLDFVHGAIQQFIGADDLQPGAVESIGERHVDAGELIAHHRARL